MTTLNPIKLWVNLFKTNPSLSVLRMTSRLAFFPGYILYFFVAAFLNGIFHVDFDPVNLFFYAYGLMVCLDVFFFEILRLKESKFKDERAFFRKHRFSPKRIDGHARFITRLKAACFLLIFIAPLDRGPAGGLLVFLMVAFPFISLLAYQLKVFQYHPLMKRYFAWIVRNGGSLSYVDQRSSSSAPAMPSYLGVSGYNIGGAYTGSSTAIGGISN